eukprot:gene15244-21326_t
MSKTVFMRGLQNFISDIRGCQNKEQEQRRVEKELAKVREKFGDDKGLNGYDRRKYVWKLLYIHMLGYDIDFGHKQACDLIPMPKYKDKQVGYMACSLLLKEGDEFLRLAINGIHMDLTSRNEAFECIALNFTSGASRPVVKKRAVLCLLKMIRKTPTEQQVVLPDTFCSIIGTLLDETDLGLLLSSMTLLYGILLRNGPVCYEGLQSCVIKLRSPNAVSEISQNWLREPPKSHDQAACRAAQPQRCLRSPLKEPIPRDPLTLVGYESLQSRVIKVLAKLRSPNAASEVPPEYLYYGIPSPWVQSMSLRVLQFYPVPESTADRTALMAQLQDIINRASSADTKSSGGTTVSSQNKNNSMHGILLEAISLCLTMPDLDRDLMVKCVSCLSTSLDSNEANIRYLALENMSRLSVLPDILGAIRQHQVTVIQALRDPDISIRRRALDLAFTVCDSSNAAEIVGELLQYLVTAEFSIREELVLKTAILAEKFASNVQWVVQLVSNNEAMQKYAATNVVEKLKRGADHESLVCASAYILGEFGRQIQAETPPMNQFKLLYTQFPAASVQTKGLLLTSFIKIYLLDPHNQELKAEVDQLFERYKKYMDSELQQRATEYMALAARPQEAASNFFLPMPKWPERESTVLRQLQKLEGTYAEDTASLSVGTNGDAITSAPSGQFLVAPPTASPPVQARSMDLLGFDSMPVPGSPVPPSKQGVWTPSASTLCNREFLRHPHPRQESVPSWEVESKQAANHNPVDTLSDLLSESLVSSRAAPYAAPYGSQGSGSLTGTQAPPPAGGWSQPQAFVAPPTMPPPQPSAAHAYDPVYDPFAPATMDAVPGAAMGAGAATAMTNNQLLAYNSAPFAGVGAATAMTNNQLPAYSSDPFAMPTQAARPAYMAAAPPPSSGLFAMAASASAPALMAAPQGGGYDPFAPPPAAPPSIANPFAPPPSVNPFAPPPSVNPTPQSSVTTASVSPQNSVPPVAAAATGAAVRNNTSQI